MALLSGKSKSHPQCARALCNTPLTTMLVIHDVPSIGEMMASSSKEQHVWKVSKEDLACERKGITVMKIRWRTKLEGCGSNLAFQNVCVHAWVLFACLLVLWMFVHASLWISVPVCYVWIMFKYAHTASYVLCVHMHVCSLYIHSFCVCIHV